METRALPQPLVMPASSEPWPSAARSWYGVVIFGLTVMTLFGNQFVVSLLIEPIKRDLALTDLQVALIVGSAAAFINAFVSLPIGRYFVDRYSRKLIIGIGLLILGITSMWSALAATATLLLIARLASGVGGAGNGPATYSMLGDMFPASKLAKAVSVMNIGFMFGLGAAMLLGATLLGAIAGVPDLTLPLLGTLRPWQFVFLVLAIPDLLLALLMLATVAEPKRRGMRSVAVAAQTTIPLMPFREVREYFWRNRGAFGPLYFGLLCNCIAMGTAFWLAPFYSRTFGWSPQQYGVIQGFLTLILAPAGLLFGGWLAERLSKRGVPDANLRVVFYGSLLHLPFAILFALVPNPYFALVLSVMSTSLISIGTGPLNAAFQSIVPNEMRGQITASFLFVFTIGAAMGPPFIGWLNDSVFGDPNAVRYSLALTHTVFGPLAALIFWKGLKPYAQAFEQSRAFHG
jgi:MFS family permease